jgi:hypothetical protein
VGIIWKVAGVDERNPIDRGGSQWKFRSLARDPVAVTPSGKTSVFPTPFPFDSSWHYKTKSSGECPEFSVSK